MPLFSKKPKPAGEMPAKPSMVVAYNMKKKFPKKMAKGGNVESAKEEKRPMPENTYNDDQNVSQNSGKKAPGQDSWTDNTWEKFGNSMSMKQGRKPAPLPVGDHKVNDRDLAEKEYSGLMDLTPGPYGEKLPEPMAEGGPVPGLDEESPHTGETAEDMLRRHANELAAAGYMAPRPPESEYDADRFAEGGDVFSKMKRKMADGGEVSLEDNSKESPNMEDQYSYEANDKELYDDGQLDEQPLESNEDGDQREKDEEDDKDASIVGAIKRKYRK